MKNSCDFLVVGSGVMQAARELQAATRVCTCETGEGFRPGALAQALAGRLAAAPLVILPSPYRSFLAPCLAYIRELREKNPDGWVTVLLPEVIPAQWWQNLLHNQRALLIRAALLFTPGVIVTAVPYHLAR